MGSSNVNDWAGELGKLYPMSATQTGEGSTVSSISAAAAEEEVLESTPECIIVDALWVLVVKCKLRKSLKK